MLKSAACLVILMLYAGAGESAVDADSSAPEPSESDQSSTEDITASDDRKSAPLETNPYLLPEKHRKSDASKLYDSGLGLIRKQQWSEAVLSFQALRESPQLRTWNFRSHLLLGYAQVMLGRDGEAVEHLKKTPGVFGAISRDLRWMLAEALFRLGRYGEAAAQYRRIVKQADRQNGRAQLLMLQWPNHYLAQAKEVESRFNNGDYQSAIDLSLRYQRQFKARAKAAGRKTEKHPQVDELIWFRARANRALDRRDEERRDLLAIKLYHPDCLYYDEALMRLGELQAGGVVMLPTSYEELVDYTDRLRMLFHYEEAMVAATAAEKITDRKCGDRTAFCTARLAYTKGRVLMGLKRYEEALAVFNGLYSDKNANEDKKPDYLYMMAKAQGRLGRIEQASGTYFRLSVDYPDSGKAGMAGFLAGWILGREVGRAKQADDMLAGFVNNSRDVVLKQKGHWFRGWIAYRAGDYTKALKLFKQMLEKYPRSPHADACRYWTARILEKLGRYEKAKSYYLQLAGEEVFTYYRLVAEYRLSRKPSGEREVALLQASFDKVTATPVGDPAVDLDLKNRELAWRRRNSVKKDPGLDFIKSMRENQSVYRSRIAAYAAIGESRRRKRMSLQADRQRNLFPDLQRFVVFDRLGMSREASEALGRHTELRLSLPRRHPTRLPRGLSAEEFALKKDRIGVIRQLPEEMWPDSFKMFLEYEDIARAFRAYTKGLSNRQRRKLPWDIQMRTYYPYAYEARVQAGAEDYAVPDHLIYAIVRSESYFKPWVVSYAGAIGLMQIMPHTGSKISERKGNGAFSRARLFDPAFNIDYGVWYIGQLLIKYKGQVPLAIAAYNGGPHNVDQWLTDSGGMEWDEFIESIGFAQTRNYVKKVLRTMGAYRKLYEGEFHAWDFGSLILAQPGDNVDF